MIISLCQRTKGQQDRGLWALVCKVFQRLSVAAVAAEPGRDPVVVPVESPAGGYRSEVITGGVFVL
ncbi:hypothetical protein [Nocardia fluminea]|uniref:hypothetical protein n=1 Tax=Nocardia fluminea TaxID=134984 RepID=UPI003D1080E8